MREVLDALWFAFWVLFWLAVVGVIALVGAGLYFLCQLAVWLLA